MSSRWDFAAPGAPPAPGGGRVIDAEAAPVEGATLRKVGGFVPGNRVFHQKFGPGTVREVEDNKLTIAFDHAGEKKVMDSFVTRDGAMTDLSWRLGVTVPDERAADAVAGLLGEVADAVTAFETGAARRLAGPGLCRWPARPAPSRPGWPWSRGCTAEPALELEKLDEIDWPKLNQESFPPLAIGRLLRPWRPCRGTAPGRVDRPADRCRDRVRHGRASGPPKAACGRSTVWPGAAGAGACSTWGRHRHPLAIAAARLWAIPAPACDIDRHSVRVASENVRINGVAPWVFLPGGRRGTFATPAVRRGPR